MINQCIKCKHKWKQRSMKRPKKCPRCSNPNWHEKNSKEIMSLIVGDFLS